MSAKCPVQTWTGGDDRCIPRPTFRSGASHSNFTAVSAADPAETRVSASHVMHVCTDGTRVCCPHSTVPDLPGSLDPSLNSIT